MVTDPRSGEILALANWPRVDDNDIRSAPGYARQNRAAGAAYEPGSTFKPFTVAGAIEDGAVTPTTSFELAPEINVADWREIPTLETPVGGVGGVRSTVTVHGDVGCQDKPCPMNNGYPSPLVGVTGPGKVALRIDPVLPRVIKVMANTTAVHGGGIVRAIMPNPEGRARKDRYLQLGQFKYLDPNGGCRPFDAPSRDPNTGPG